MSTHQMLQTESLINKIASAIEYNIVNTGDCLMLHVKQGYFSLTPAFSVSGKKFQGYVECVSADTLESLIGLGETSYDGLKEAAIIENWMKNQK